MYSSDATREILIALPANNKASVDNHVAEFLLAGEALDALNQVLVTVAVPSDQLPDQGDGAEAPALVDGVEERPVLVDLAELEHGQDAAGFQDAVGLAQGLGDVAKIADAKGDRVQVDGVVGDAGRLEVLGVGLEEGEGGLLAGGQAGGGALLADGQHGRVDVGDGDADVGVGVDDVRRVQVPKGNVARAAGDVEDVLGGGVEGVGGGGGGVEAGVEGGDVVISGGEK